MTEMTGNRLSRHLRSLKEEGKKAFVAYLMAGDPSLEMTCRIVKELERIGVSAVELGVPFSDPIADGPVIQAAAGRALARGVTLEAIYGTVERLRRDTAIPLLLMGYWNVFLNYGRRRCLERAGSVGVDGLIIADLPPEADPGFFAAARQQEVCTVLLASQATPERRLKTIAAASTGFLYYVPQAGTTGLELQSDPALPVRLELIRSLTDIPVCIGIGVKSRADVQRLKPLADGVIVGTRIVEFIRKNEAHADLPKRLSRMVERMLP